MSVTTAAHWTDAQIIAAYHALKAHSDRHASSPIRNPESFALVWQRIQDGSVQAAFIEGYLVVYDVGPTWCTSDNLLYELLLIRATAEGDFDAYVSGLQELAKQNACIGIMTGNGVLRPGLARQYTRRGFQKFNESYYLEVRHGCD